MRIFGRHCKAFVQDMAQGQFPSPANLGISTVNSAASSLSLNVPCLAAGPCTHLIAPKSFGVAYTVSKVATGPTPNLTVTSAAKQIVEIDGTGNLIVSISNLKDDSAAISLDGAEIAAATGGTLAGGIVTLTTNGSVALQLENLTPGVTVTVQVEGKKGGKSTGKTSVALSAVAATRR
jgi:hypothetical protein